MKKVYIIEVDESEIVECWNEQSVKELGYQEYALKQCPGIKVKSYNPTGDCISRVALKAKMFDIPKPKEGATFWDGVDTVGNLIDNAPAVDIKDEIAGAYNEGYACGSREAGKARPKGECCGSCYLCDVGDCKADMRKGGADMQKGNVK